MSGSPAITVVIPVRNRAAMIAAAIDSVLAQTYPAAEILVVDDGSEDGTAQAALASGDPRIRVVRLPRANGAQAARNEGIRQARSAWIAFLDSDDEWLPSKLALQVDALAGAGFDPWTFVHTGFHFVDHVRGTRLQGPVAGAHAADGDGAYEALLRAPGPVLPSFLTSRTALEAIGLLDEEVPSFQEWDTAIRLAERCRVLFVAEPLFLYHLHAGPTISKDPVRTIDGYEYVIRKFEREIVTRCGVEAWDEHLRQQVYRCLDARLWSRARDLLREMSEHGWRDRVLSVCCALHVRPSSLVRLRKAIAG